MFPIRSKSLQNLFGVAVNIFSSSYIYIYIKGLIFFMDVINKLKNDLNQVMGLIKKSIDAPDKEETARLQAFQIISSDQRSISRLMDIAYNIEFIVDHYRALWDSIVELQAKAKNRADTIPAKAEVAHQAHEVIQELNDLKTKLIKI
jgi:hypothetical protein